MRHSFFCIDAHTCGNPVRLVAGGGPLLPHLGAGTIEEGLIALRRPGRLFIGAGRLQERHGASAAAIVQDFLDYRGTTAAGILRVLEIGWIAACQCGARCRSREACLR